MSDTTEDPMVQHLRDRVRELEDRITDAQARKSEIEALIGVITDGRSRINRTRRKAGNSAAPPATQPGGYDDSVSLDEAQGVLAP